MAEGQRLEIRPIPLDSTWENFVDTATGSHPFVRGAWLRCAREALGSDLIVRGAYSGEALVGAVAGQETTGRVRRLATPALLPHAGFLFRRPLSDQLPRQEADRTSAWQALLADSDRFQHLHLSCGPGIIDVREALWAGWQAHPRYTYQLDLPQDRQQVWDGLERRTRTVIRKAENGGYRVQPTVDHAAFGELYRQTYGNTAPPVDTDLTQRFVLAALAAGLVEGHSVIAPSGQTVATVYFALDRTRQDSCLYAWVAGVDPACRDSGASALLYWKVLEATSASSFDFVGANMASIALFKRGFGGRLVSYHALEKWNSSWRRWVATLRG